MFAAVLILGNVLRLLPSSAGLDAAESLMNPYTTLMEFSFNSLHSVFYIGFHRTALELPLKIYS